MGNGGIGAAVVEPVRGAKTARLEHVRAVLAEAPAAAEPGAVKRRPRPQVLPLPGPVRRDQARVFNSGMKKKSAITDIGEISGISGFFIFIFIFYVYFLNLFFSEINI